MAITRIKNSTISNKTPKYNDVLAGLPYRPIIGTATDGGNGTSVSVAFTGNNVANGTITYTALSSPGSFTGTGTASPITVSGLTSGTAYTFQVKAGNSLGDSAYSAASNSVTPVTPTAFDSIASNTLSVDTATVTFSSIPGTYQHLQLRCITRSSGTGTTLDDLYLQVNSTTSGYAYHALRGDGASVSAVGSISNSNMKTQGIVPQNGNTSGIFGVTIIDIHDYASTTKNKTVRAFSGIDKNGSGWVTLNSWLAQTTSAVTSLTFTSDNNFKAGSTFALYGIAGA